MKKARTKPGRRLCLLDELRGLFLLLMIAFHGLYSAGYIYNVAWCARLFLFFSPLQPLFAGGFILLCGLCCRLSRSNLKRGLLLLAAAVLMSGLLFFSIRWGGLPSGNMIWFGILHFLSVAILLFVLLRRLLDKIPPLLGILLCTALTVLTLTVPPQSWPFLDASVPVSTFGVPGVYGIAIPQSWIDIPWLTPLGIGTGLEGADCFPLFPWLFVFLAGSYIGVWAKEGKFPQWTYKPHIALLSWLGRHSLILYLLHQPVLVALLWIIFQIF